MNARSSLGSDLKNIGLKSMIYGSGTVLLRVINLLLLPLYTYYLTPEEYGIVAIGASLTALLSIIMPLSLYSAIVPFFFKIDSSVNRRKMMGNIWFGMLASGFLISLVLQIFGHKLFTIVFPQLLFVPYGQISIWTAFFTIFSFLPLGIWQAEEKPTKYIFWTTLTLFLTVGFTILFVVIFRLGAIGYLSGTLAANLIVAIPFTVITLKNIDLKINFSDLKEAAIFSLPLLPHGLSNWVLAVSDRAILQFYVSVSALGIYSLGYTFGMIQIFVGTSITQAWIPFLFKRVAEEGKASESRISRMITYFVFFYSFLAVGLSFFSREIVYLLTNQSFHSAADIVPIIVMSYLWNGLYIIPLNFLMLKSKTVLIPLVTVPAALINIGINISLVPYFGIIAAAWATFFAFLSQLIIVQILAFKAYPFPYESRRIAIVLSVAVFIIFVSMLLSFSPLTNFFLKILSFVLFPILLYFCGFFLEDEKIFLKEKIIKILSSFFNFCTFRK